MVQDQELLIQTVNRQAMMAELNTISGLAGTSGGSAGWGIIQWTITTLSILGISIVGYFIYNNYQKNDITSNITEDNQIENQEKSIISDTGNFISFELKEATSDYEEEIEVYSKNDKRSNIKLKEPSDLKVSSLVDIKDRGLTPVIDNSKPKINEIKTVINKDITARNREAQFPGGKIRMKEFFKKQLRYPRTPKDKGLQGTVKLNFLVSEDGKITHLESDCFIMKDKHGKPLSPGKMFTNKKSQKYFEQNAAHIFKISPPWTPATNSDGNQILSTQCWYVNFDINGKSSAYQLDDEILIAPPCSITTESEWEKVEVQPMQVKHQSKKFKLMGESILEVQNKINKVVDLSEIEYKKICQMAARSKACIVYIDVHNFWKTTDGNLYYYFGSFNQEKRNQKEK